MAAPARKHDTTTVRIDQSTDSILSRLSQETGEAKKEIIARAIERTRRERILDSANAGFAALKASQTGWAEELEERRVWEVTLSDGIGRE